MRAAGHGPERIGSVAVAFAAGGVGIAVPLGRYRVGPRRLLVGALAVLGLTLALIPLVASSARALALIRLVEGAAMVGIWVGYEAALFSRASAEDRATVSALYAMVLAAGYVVGPLIARALLPFGLAAGTFAVASGLTLANAVGVRVLVGPDVAPAAPAPAPAATDSRPEEERSERAASDSFAALAGKVKVTGFGMFAAGYHKATLVLFLPLFLVDHRRLGVEAPPIVLSVYAAGSFLFTHVAGRVGDRRGHLRTMVILAAIGGLAMIGLVTAGRVDVTCAIAFVAGATLGSISPLGMALQASIAPAQEYSRAMSLSNGLYAAGTLVGPFVTGLVYAAAPRAALVQVAALWLAFSAFALVFASDDPRRKA